MARHCKSIQNAQWTAVAQALLQYVCGTFHGRMHMRKDSLHHLERQHLRRVNAAGLPLPGFCLHLVFGPPCATEFRPANTIPGLLPDHVVYHLQLANKHAIRWHWLCKDSMHAKIPAQD